MVAFYTNQMYKIDTNCITLLMKDRLDCFMLQSLSRVLSLSRRTVVDFDLSGFPFSLFPLLAALNAHDIVAMN